MAEVIGAFASVVTIAALFKNCVDAFDLVQAVRHEEPDRNRLLLKLTVEKCRLYTWGEMMLLTSTSQPSEPRPLDRFLYREVVIQTLQSLHDLFNDSQRIQERYGCGKAAPMATDDGDEGQSKMLLAAASLHCQISPQKGKEIKLGQKTRWVTRDRKKFAELVPQVRELVDGLQEITKSIAPINLQQSAMTSRIATVTDLETLQSISEACEEDHPLFSQVASLRSEILSMPDTKRAEIDAWLSDETSPLDPDMIDFENMDLPELKQRIFSLSRQRQQMIHDCDGLRNQLITANERERLNLSDSLEASMEMINLSEASIAQAASIEILTTRSFILFTVFFVTGFCVFTFLLMIESVRFEYPEYFADLIDLASVSSTLTILAMTILKYGEGGIQSRLRYATLQ